MWSSLDSGRLQLLSHLSASPPIQYSTQPLFIVTATSDAVVSAEDVSRMYNVSVSRHMLLFQRSCM